MPVNTAGTPQRIRPLGNGGRQEREGDAVRVQYVPQQGLRVGEHVLATASDVAYVKADVQNYPARGVGMPRAHCSRNALAEGHFVHRPRRQRSRSVGILAGRNGEEIRGSTGSRGASFKGAMARAL